MNWNKELKYGSLTALLVFLERVEPLQAGILLIASLEYACRGSLQSKWNYS